MQINISKRVLAIAGMLLACATLVGACSLDEGDKQDSKDNEKREAEATKTGMNRMSQSQPVPVFDYSEERQTLIDAETIRAEGTHGTAVVTTISGELLWWCPTAGAPVPSTYQLTDPWETEWNSWGQGGGGSAVTGRPEATGVYTGDSAATWVKCLDDNGTVFGMYDEANVRWIGGVVENLPADKRARVDEITFKFTEEEKAK